MKVNDIVHSIHGNSIVHVTRTLANRFSSSFEPSGPALGEAINKRKICLMILDGFGVSTLQHYRDTLPFLIDRHVTTVSSVYPCTTASALISLYSGDFPITHGYIGWTQYFPEINRYIEVLPHTDFMTGQPVDPAVFDANVTLNPNSIFKLLSQKSPQVGRYAIGPSVYKASSFTRQMLGNADYLGYETPDQMLAHLSDILTRNEDWLATCYCPFPDSLCHDFGIGAEPVHQFFAWLNSALETLTLQLPKDAAIFITADHGMIDIQNYEQLDQQPEVIKSLKRFQYPEPRFSSFHLAESAEAFYRWQNEHKDNFLFLNRSEFMDSGLLGIGPTHPYIPIFLGDVMMMATSDIGIKTHVPDNPEANKHLKAHHAGLTPNEMQVPVIVLTRD